MGSLRRKINDVLECKHSVTPPKEQCEVEASSKQYYFAVAIKLRLLPYFSAIQNSEHFPNLTLDPLFVTICLAICISIHKSPFGQVPDLGKKPFGRRPHPS